MTFFLIIFYLFGCEPSYKNIKNENKVFYKKVYKHFVFIKVKQSFEATDCKITSNNKVEDCLSLIKNAPKFYVIYNGSGGLIKNNGQAKILTAGHVCSTKQENEQTITKNNLTIKVKYKNEISAYQHDGNEIKVKIDKIDYKNDLCLLNIYDEDLYNNGVELSTTEPKIGEDYYAVSAPLGMFSNNLAPIFTGIFSGKLPNNEILFTIYSDSGSSGSLVLNRFNKVVGMIIKTRLDLHSISISPNFDVIKEFLK